MIPGYELVLPPGWKRMPRPDPADATAGGDAVSQVDALTRLSDIYTWHAQFEGVDVGASLAVTLVRRVRNGDDLSIVSELGVEVDTWYSTLNTEPRLLCALRDRTESIGGREIVFRDWFFFVPRGDGVYAVLQFTSPNAPLWSGFDALFRAITSTLRFT